MVWSRPPDQFIVLLPGLLDERGIVTAYRVRTATDQSGDVPDVACDGRSWFR